MPAKEQLQLDSRTLTKEQLERYWPNGKPDVIIFATASVRKGLFAYLALKYWLQNVNPDDSDTPGFTGANWLDYSNPMAFQASVEAQIRNGDGKAKEQIPLGYLFGVPVILVPQDGESGTHDVVEESKRKVDSVSSLFPGQKVVAFGCDTTSKTISSRGTQMFGKPTNEADYDQETFDSQRYLTDHYWDEGKEVTVTHVTAFVMRLYDETANSPKELIIETKLIKQAPQVLEQLLALKVYLESGGGAMIQQVIKWTSDILDQIDDELMREVLRDFPEDIRAFLLIMSVMGFNAWLLLPALRDLTKLRYT
ncbi:MAG: hypothetical protein A3A82_03090 [Candidatus Pacebacteria bacterium RIFCSPLOWO2_01_FULL_47_12]|nr:MAG: hypothetical protein A3A82_03090 [Candidatus Pacebacteria bacterium RIFCSPLOWO2_01_FULL_47_12]